jgi:hypothetical protein
MATIHFGRAILAIINVSFVLVRTRIVLLALQQEQTRLSCLVQTILVFLIAQTNISKTAARIFAINAIHLATSARVVLRLAQFAVLLILYTLEPAIQFVQTISTLSQIQI